MKFDIMEHPTLIAKHKKSRVDKELSGQFIDSFL